MEVFQTLFVALPYLIFIFNFYTVDRIVSFQNDIGFFLMKIGLDYNILWIKIGLDYNILRFSIRFE